MVLCGQAGRAVLHLLALCGALQARLLPLGMARRLARPASRIAPRLRLALAAQHPQRVHLGRGHCGADGEGVEIVPARRQRAKGKIVGTVCHMHAG